MIEVRVACKTKNRNDVLSMNDFEQLFKAAKKLGAPAAAQVFASADPCTAAPQGVIFWEI